MANEVGAGDHSVVEGMDGGTRKASTMECDAYGLMVIARISSTSEARSPPMRDLSADLLMKYLAISISPETLSLEDERMIIHGGRKEEILAALQLGNVLGNFLHLEGELGFCGNSSTKSTVWGAFYGMEVSWTVGNTNRPI